MYVCCGVYGVFVSVCVLCVCCGVCCGVCMDERK